MISSLTSASATLSSDSLSRLFQKADANGDNTLSQDELLNALSGSDGSTGTSDSVASLFQEMDSDGDGSLSQNEFSSFGQMFAADSGKALLSAQEETADTESDTQTQETAYSSDLFDTLDSDGDGVISESEFTSALQSQGDGETLSEDDLAELFSTIDANGDSSISAEELSSAMSEAAGAPPPPPPPPSEVSGASEDAAAADSAESADSSTDETSEAAASSASSGGAGGASNSESYDPLDTNEDGVVSATERAAGERDSFGLLNGSTLGALMQFNEVSQAA